MRRKINREWQRRRKEDARKAYAALMKFYPLSLNDLDGEEWRDIRGYDGDYQISNFGRVKSFCRSKARIIEPSINGGEYLHVGLYKGGKGKRYSIHRLVAEAFIPNPDNLSQVDHRFGMKLDNYFENLRWVTVSENTKAAFDMGLAKSAQGEDHVEAKLTNKDAVYIRENPDGLTMDQLAEMFGVGRTTIIDIRLGRKYLNAGGTIHKKADRRVPDEIRAEIRRLYVKDSREFGATALAKLFGLGETTILRIVHEDEG